MKRALLIVFTFIYIAECFSQVSLRGKLVDEDYNPQVEFDIKLNSIDSSNTFSTKSGLDGSFSLLSKRGTYKFTVSQFNEVFYSDTIFLIENEDLGVIPVLANHQLETIEIMGKKKLIERKHDRIVYNVEHGPMSQGVGADELLKNVPRIDPTSDMPKIFGKSFVSIMVNDKLLNLSGNDLRNYLQSLRSENIEKIEVILNPSSKYDASGNSGIINIQLKKNKNLGFEANMVTTYVQRTDPSINESFGLNYSNGKFILSYNGYLGYEQRVTEHRNEFIFSDHRRITEEFGKRENKGYSNNLNLEYGINDRLNIGLAMDFNEWDNKQNYLTNLSNNTVVDDEIHTVDMSAVGNGSYGVFNISPYVEIQLDTLGKKLKMNYNYLSNSTKMDNVLTGDDITPKNQNPISQNINNNDFHINSVNLDMELPFSFLSVESGFKYSSIETENDAKYFIPFSNNNQLDESMSNKFSYGEDIVAAYLNLSKEFGDIIFLSAGLRYEGTRTKGTLSSGNSINNNKYGNLFPSISLSYEPDANHSFSLGYNKRIFRPTLDEVNPFKVYRDQINYTVGNPDLFPSITDNIEIGYLFKGSLSFSLYTSKTKNNALLLATPIGDGSIIEMKPINALTTYDLGGDVGYNWRKKWFSNFTSVALSHQYSKTFNPENEVPDKDLKGLNAMMSTNSTISLADKNNTKLFINAYYSLPSIEGIYKSKEIFMFRLGGSMSFFNEKLGINCFFTDIFNTAISRNNVNYGSFQMINRLFNDNRNLSLALAFKFGNAKAKRAKTNLNIIEKDRLSPNK